ncbi:hypothetical protein KP509_10G037200 [Ceratopteris richardii]|nr:hypothetical protein KP509_10G037200 [Ceratopteris richardii]
MGNLESIAEINIGDAAGKAESNELNGDGQANLSWISSLFHRKWRSKNKTFSGHGNSNTNSPFTRSEAGSALNDVGGTNLLQLPPLEPGRLSWDGPKSNFKHILKRIEARKKHQRVDCSPLHAPSAVEDARQECFCDDPEMGQLSSLQKSKSVTSSRDAVSFEMPKSSRPPLATISSKQCVNDNLLEVCDNTHVTDKESRRWGRAWNKSLSPLMGFKQHGLKGVRGSRHLHSGFATPRHVVNFNKSSTGASSFSSPHISSLPNHENILDVHLRLAQ